MIQARVGEDEARLPGILALQKRAGNAAVWRLLAGANSVQRLAESDAPGADVLAMAGIAWDTGVAQREKDAAEKLKEPGAGKPQLQDAYNQLQEAEDAAEKIVGQISEPDSAKHFAAASHENGIAGERESVVVIQGHTTPNEIGTHITDNLIPHGERTKEFLTQSSASPSSSQGG